MIESMKYDINQLSSEENVTLIAEFYWEGGKWSYNANGIK
jgi:hypothetical protein